MPWIDQVNHFEDAYKARITSTQNVMNDMCSLFDREIDFIKNGRTVHEEEEEEEVNNEAVEEHLHESVAVTHPLVATQQQLQQNPSRAVCTASNCVQVTWTIDAKKLSGKKSYLSSHDFEFCQGQRFLLIVRACPLNMKGGFQASRGVGRVELKFNDGAVSSGKVHYRVAVGQNKQLPFQGLDHDFDAQPLSILQHKWDFLSTANKGLVLLHLEGPLIG